MPTGPIPSEAIRLANDPAFRGRYVSQAISQTAQQVSATAFKVQPFTAGQEPFQVMFNSFPNTGVGAGTYNHAMHIGFNAAVHSDTSQVTAGKVAMYMGFEDNYYDDGGDATYGPEWYVGYCTPDRTSVPIAALRPFYCRVKDGNVNSPTKSVIITMDIGNGTGGGFAIYNGISNAQVFQVQPTLVSMKAPLRVDMVATGNALRLAGFSNNPANLLFRVNATDQWVVQADRFLQMIWIDQVNAKQTMILLGASTVDTAKLTLNAVLQLNNSVSTSATAGGASALPATPQGYFQVKDSAGVTRKVPYYV